MKELDQLKFFPVLNICTATRCLVAQFVRLYAAPWTVACQAPWYIEFSRQEYWSALPFPTPGDLPDSGMELVSLAASALVGRFGTTAPAGKPINEYNLLCVQRHSLLQISKMLAKALQEYCLPILAS